MDSLDKINVLNIVCVLGMHVISIKIHYNSYNHHITTSLEDLGYFFPNDSLGEAELLANYRGFKVGLAMG